MPTVENQIARTRKEIAAYQRALDASSIVVITDAKGIITSVNDNFCKISQYSAEELIGQTHKVVNSGLHPKQFFADMWATIRSGEMWKGEIRNRAKDGSFYWVDTTIVPFPDDEGQPIQYVSIRTDITLRKEASDSKYHLLFDKSRDGLLIGRPDGSFIEANEALCRLLGYTYDEFLRLSRKDITIADDPNLQKALQIRLNTGYYEGPLKYKRKDGSILDTEVTTAIYKDESGEVRTYVCIRDITEKLKADENLRNSEKRFRELIENSKDAIMLSTLDGKAIYVSPAVKGVLGYESDELIGKNISVLCHPDELQTNLDRRKNLKSRESSNTLLRVLHKSGKWRMIEATITNQLDDPAINAIVTNFRDVTDKIEAEQNLRNSEMRYRALIENNKDVIALSSSEGVIVYMSPSVRDLLGYEPEELSNTFAMDLMHPDELENNVKLQAWLGENPGKSVYLIMRMKHKNGLWRWIDATSTSQLDNPAVNAIVSNLRDITDRKKAEEELENLNLSLEKKINERTVQLQEANKALESFSYMAAHDLQSPLRIQAGYASILKEIYSVQLGTDGVDLIDVIVQSTKHMSQLVSDLLEFSRISHVELKKESVNFDGLVHHLVEQIIAKGNNPNVKINYKEMGYCFCDPNLMKQVWVNLISNAVKYSAKKEEPVIEIGSQMQGDEKVYYVRDNGAGFNQAFAHKLFNVFQRLHSAGDFEGTGVGLAIVSSIIKRHNGRVWAEGAIGEGATFYFTMPG